MANRTKKKKLSKDNINSIESNINLEDILDQNQITLKICSEGQFLQMIHTPSGLSITIPNNMVENVNHKQYMLQKLLDKVDDQMLYKANIIC